MVLYAFKVLASTCRAVSLPLAIQARAQMDAYKEAIDLLGVNMHESKRILPL